MHRIAVNASAHPRIQQPITNLPASVQEQADVNGAIWRAETVGQQDCLFLKTGISARAGRIIGKFAIGSAASSLFRPQARLERGDLLLQGR